MLQGFDLFSFGLLRGYVVSVYVYTNPLGFRDVELVLAGLVGSIAPQFETEFQLLKHSFLRAPDMGQQKAGHELVLGLTPRVIYFLGHVEHTDFLYLVLVLQKLSQRVDLFYFQNLVRPVLPVLNKQGSQLLKINLRIQLREGRHK
jgi:hypothetical protein